MGNAMEGGVKNSQGKCEILKVDFKFFWQRLDTTQSKAHSMVNLPNRLVNHGAA